MAKKRSVKRRQKKSEKQRIINERRKREIKKLLKEVKELIKKGEIEKAKNFLPKIYKLLDKAKKIHLFKEGKAERLKSRISRLIFKSQK